MKKIDLGQTVSILANLGVIAGIVFLAVELRQNNEMMMSQTRSDIAYNISDMLMRSSLSDYAGDVFFQRRLKRLVALRRYVFRISTWPPFEYGKTSTISGVKAFTKTRNMKPRRQFWQTLRVARV